MPLQDIFSPIIEQFSAFLNHPIWQSGTIRTIKIISGGFSAFLFVLIIILITKSDRLWKMKLARESVKAVHFPKQFDKKWQIILTRMKRKDEANMKLAVIEADKLFDTLLQHMGYQGKDMSERLEKLTPVQLSNLEDIWLAHKVRNRIVHEPEHHITLSEAESAIAAFEKAFKELQVL